MNFDDYETILFERNDKVLTVTLDGVGPFNGVNEQMHQIRIGHAHDAVSLGGVLHHRAHVVVVGDPHVVVAGKLAEAVQSVRNAHPLLIRVGGSVKNVP